jgi:hypothetical protein
MAHTARPAARRRPVRKVVHFDRLNGVPFTTEEHRHQLSGGAPLSTGTALDARITVGPQGRVTTAEVAERAR